MNKVSLFCQYLLGAHLIMIIQCESKCSKEGWIPLLSVSHSRYNANDDSRCVPCPEGHFCQSGSIYPQKCSAGMFSTSGSSRCCPLNSTCSPGFAVFPNAGCQCMRVECPYTMSDYERNAPPSKMMYDISNNDEGRIICVKDVEGCSNMYESCPGMIQHRDNCMCFDKTHCMDAKRSHLQYWYSTTDMSFRCVNQNNH